MKEITILSGKGGTGKTSITAALASVAKDVIFCDNDVDAADLHLIFHPVVKEEHVFQGAYIASIHKEKCDSCGACMEYCRFNAIHQIQGEYSINPQQCEGCRLCERICPAQAITSVQSENNSWFVSDSRFGVLIHAKMGPGEENSGKLVTRIRKKARELTNDNNIRYIINDGPPGIGCAAISSISGCDLVLIVTEPSKSGLHDAGRLVDLVKTFHIPAFAMINKYDINKKITDEIESYMKINDIPVLAKIPFHESVIQSMVEGKTIIEYADESEISRKIREVWDVLKQ